MSRSGRLGAVTLLAVFLSVSPFAALAAPVDRQAKGADSWTVTGVRFEPLHQISVAPLTVADVGVYRGSIEVKASPTGVAVINHVSVEDYVAGISEVPPTWPAEAQKAQAIAARTYALWEWDRTPPAAAYKALGADICATDACQVYRGVGRERQDDSEAWLAAVEATKSRAIYWRDRPIKAMYSSSNGGHMVAGAEPYLRAGLDPDDRWSPLTKWSIAYPLAEVIAAAELPVGTVSIHREGDTVWSVSPGAGEPVLAAMPAADFRSRLNTNLARPEGLPMPLPTIRFGLGTIDGAVRADGIGWGHAIGMSQWGAYGKARRGMKADEILATYYSGLRSVVVPDSRLPDALKVAVDLGRREAIVAPETGRFRVVAADGAVLAHATSGPWTVTPDRDGRVVVRAPADQAGPAAASVATANPGPAALGEAVVLSLELPRPAAVTITATPPGGDLVVVDLGVVGPGQVEAVLPASERPGVYVATVDTDAGGGRLASTPFEVAVSSPAAIAALASTSGGPASPSTPLGLPATVAATLLLAVTVWLVRIGRPLLPGLH